LQKYVIDKNTIFVPTMGGLHLGHLSLIDIAKNTAKINNHLVVVSIFLNPAQFGKNEDLKSYPVDLKDDVFKLKQKNIDILFLPSVDEIYPENYKFNYKIGRLSTILCAKTRPDFFPGIVKVVYRLFNIIKPKIAIFGKKDFQQLLIIKKLVQDFNLDIKILNGSLIRGDNGLALSTRNKYLGNKELKNANNIYKYLQQAKLKVLEDIDLTIIKEDLTIKLQKDFNFDYCEILNADNLGKIDKNTKNIIIIVAVVLGKTRLIDNLIINTNLKE